MLCFGYMYMYIHMYACTMYIYIVHVQMCGFHFIVELKSKTITEKMLEGMVRVCDQELRTKTDQPQVD